MNLNKIEEELNGQIIIWMKLYKKLFKNQKNEISVGDKNKIFREINKNRCLLDSYEIINYYDYRVYEY